MSSSGDSSTRIAEMLPPPLPPAPLLSVSSDLQTTSSGWLNYLWRLVVTGITWALFGLGALVVLCVVLSVVNWVPASDAVRAKRVRGIIRRAFALFSWWGEFCGLFAIRVKGFDATRLEQPKIIIANHPSLIDVVILVGMLPDVNCIVKQAIFRNPFFAHIARMAQYIENANSEELIEDCADRIRLGHSVLLFPEGTRSPRNSLRRFNRGAARIAIHSGAEILPVVIRFSPPALLKGQPWYRIPERKISIELVFGKPVKSSALISRAPSAAAAARHLTSYLESYYESNLFSAESSVSGKH